MIKPMEKGKRILIVDDDPSFALEVAETLREKGYTVAGIVATGERAITHARETCPDLVLMDILLEGDLDGREAAREIRVSQGTPVIFMTAFGDKKQSKSLKLSPPKGLGYLVKPFTKSELLNEIRRVFRSGVDTSILTGNSVIDGQHRELIRRLKEMAAFLREGKGEQTHVSCRKLWELFDAHCADEEGILRDARYPRLDDHLVSHAETIARISQIRSACQETCKENHVGSCMENMKSILNDHLLREDMAFASFLLMKAPADDKHRR